MVLDSSGWVSVQELTLACQAHGYTFTESDLNEVVATNSKKRFEFSQDGLCIRARQGHSLEVDLGYESAAPPPILYHGTATRFLDSIKAAGLHKQMRHHVHLSASSEVAREVGRRYGKVALLEIDALRMHNDGHEFFLSGNGVWLTDNVPVEYIRFPEQGQCLLQPE